VGRDGFGLREQVAELVDAVHEAVARERLDREADRAAVRQRDRRCVEVDLDLGTGVLDVA
jgi:hypothetical protein